MVLATGSFRSLAHETSGTASILELDDGSRFLRIEDLDTSSGPDVRVYLSEAPADASDETLDDAFVDLGGLKGNQAIRSTRSRPVWTSQTSRASRSGAGGSRSASASPRFRRRPEHSLDHHDAIR